MNFASDNWAGAHTKIAEALVKNAAGYASAYGSSDLDKQVEQTFCEIFERDVAVFFVGTGTAANALSLTWASRPGGVAFCHSEAHAIEDEGGAPEYFTGGGRLKGVAGDLGRIAPDALDAAIRHYPAEFVHAGQPMAASITQATEIGTLYSLEQIEAIGRICRDHGIPLHLDGARFANALVALDATPAEMTWKRGVDIVSFGGTKNGCWCAEAVIVLDPAKAGGMPFLRKRAAHLFSKSRFIAAQFEAYFEDDLWLQLARHSNAMAQILAETLEASDAARLAWRPQANEVFAVMNEKTAAALQAGGARFHAWNPPLSFAGQLAQGEGLYRFVTSFATGAAEIEAFADRLSARR
ncbi:low specificity L-threonine aldolase [Nitratireductor sp. ZSWI3]|uniref:threonine aldolase family protein n=1 Tax=Nitratireductor sp. ZSWI3 TaxID=2966359 RepID=UPI00214FE711|nr:low specificity L-threonine aldolase [Nitratireductor sp. ZSWI3]MCR4264965.1 low specificity L-threonine aldolase [Nitratireductor sp. ZSWI3]